MTSIEDILERKPDVPKRELSANFTGTVVAEIKTHPYETKKEKQKMIIFKKPLIAVFAALIVLGAMTGTTYAATDGFTKPFDMRNIFGYREMTLSDGSKVVRVKTSECSAVTYLNEGDHPVSDNDLYIRQKPNSPLSSQDVLKYVQGYCETEQEGLQYIDVAKKYDAQYPGDKGYRLEFGGGIVAAKTAATITVRRSEVTAQGQQRDVKEVLTYTDASTLESLGHKSLRRDDIEVGRLLTTIALTKGSEKQLLYAHQSTAAQTIYEQHRLDSSVSGSDAYGKYLERIMPCSTNKSGFCAWKQQTTTDTGGTIEDIQVERQKASTRYENEQKSKINGAAAHIAELFTTYSQNATNEGLTVFLSEVTPELRQTLTQEHGYNPITCSQSDFASISFGAPIVENGIMKVAMFGAFEGGPSRSVSEISYDMNKGKVANITCSADLGL